MLIIFLAGSIAETVEDYDGDNGDAHYLDETWTRADGCSVMASYGEYAGHPDHVAIITCPKEPNNAE